MNAHDGNVENPDRGNLVGRRAEETDGMMVRRIGRRDLLRAAGIGAGVLAVPSLLGGPGSEAAHASVLPGILRNGTYPIGFWWPPPPQETTVARYAEIADAGFTFVTGGNGVWDMPANDVMLNAAAEVGLPAIVIDHRIQPPSVFNNYPREQWREVISSTLRDYQRYSAFAGFALDDEPNAAVFGTLGEVTRTLRELDPTKLGYTNLFPTYVFDFGGPGTATYQEYLDRFVAEVDPALISFDHYMLVGPSPGVRGDYFYNWVLVRNKSLQTGLPSWVFILACQHFGYRLPTEAELLWQVNVSLAYGCKGIQYFTYWTPDGDGFYQALVTVDGQLTPLYYAAQRINNHYLRPVGKQLLDLTSESVTHFGEAKPPMGVEVFTGDDWVRSASGDAVILSRFSDLSVQEQRWLLVANRAFDSASTAVLTLGPAAGAVLEFDPSREEFIPLPPEGQPGRSRILEVKLAPGAARLYRLHNLRHSVTVDRIDAELPMIGTKPNTVQVTVRNSLSTTANVTVTVDGPEGWSSGTTTAAIESSGSDRLAVQVFPPLEPAVGVTLTTHVTGENHRVYGLASATVVTTPSGDAVALALDAGTDTSPLVQGYQRLSPQEVWDPARGFGWVGDPPQARDRGEPQWCGDTCDAPELDDLRRDFTLNRTKSTTLRVAVPPGVHQAYVLTGDATSSSGNTIISDVDGKVLAQVGGTQPAAQFTWLKFPVDGGPEGREVDLIISAEGNAYWRMNALVLMGEPQAGGANTHA